MSGHEGPAPVADISAESFPDYAPAIHDSYVDGYDPVSLSAPHSSLVQHSTWIGMGLILASLAGFGALIYGAAMKLWENGSSPNISSTLLIVGACITAVCLIGATVAISAGRKNYKNYRKTTGRRN